MKKILTEFMNSYGLLRWTGQLDFPGASVGNVTHRFLPPRLAWLLVIMLALPSIVLAAGDADKPDSPPDTMTAAELVQALRSGGYILYFRHGITDHSTYDRDRENLQNCETQRLLSDEGRAQMRVIGIAISTLDIRVSTVLSSPYCRSIDTAKQAFGRMQIDADLKHTVTADEATAARQATALRKLLSTVPAPGSNSVLSSHTANLQDATGIWPKPEGVAIVFQPLANGDYRYIATIEPKRWQELLQFAAP